MMRKPRQPLYQAYQYELEKCQVLPEMSRFGGIVHSFSLRRPHQRCALHQWLETKRKRKLEAHEVFSEDPALYRWQCWASTCEDPNSKDPTFVEDPRFRTSDTNKVRCHLKLGVCSQG